MASRLWIRRILWSALGLLAALAIVAVLTFRYGLEAYRGEIERRVEQSTGRPFRLRGPLELRLSPLVGVDIGAAELDEPPGMSGPPFASWRSARIDFQLLPLLHHRLVVSHVRIDGLEVHLRREADGRTNWADLGQLAGAGAGAGASGAKQSEPMELRSLAVRDGTIDLSDEGNGRHARLSALQLDMGPAQIARRIEIGATRLTARIASSALPVAAPVRLDLAGLIVIPTPLQLIVPGWSLHFANAVAKGSLAASSTRDGWQARGPLSLSVASVRDLAAVLGVDALKSADAQAFGAFRLTGDWSLAGGALTIQTLRARLDETTLTGRIVREPANVPADGEPLIEVDLRGDRIDFGRYVAGGQRTSRRFELPVAALRALRVRGSVTFVEARYDDVVMKNARLEMTGGAPPASARSAQESRP